MNDAGICPSHAFTFLSAMILNFAGKKVRLVQLRNPWGKYIYKGG
mgnify:FL=1|jgi:hypothetical protein